MYIGSSLLILLSLTLKFRFFSSAWFLKVFLFPSSISLRQYPLRLFSFVFLLVSSFLQFFSFSFYLFCEFCCFTFKCPFLQYLLSLSNSDFCCSLIISNCLSSISLIHSSLSSSLLLIPWSVFFISVICSSVLICSFLYFLGLCWSSHWVPPFFSQAWKAFLWLLLWTLYQVNYLYLSLVLFFPEVLFCSFI